MEKYSQFRDRGSGISPFIPIKTPSTFISALPRFFIFIARLPIFLPYVAVYFLLLHHLPLPTAIRKLLLWGILGIPGIWWVDLQLDGVKRGQLSSQPPSRFPRDGCIIAANSTSPIDAIYLAAIFDPIFTISYPGTQKVLHVSLPRAAWYALSGAQVQPPPRSGLTDLRALKARYPDQPIVVFPECATTNGKGILPLSPSLLSAAPDTRIFPLSIRYAPPDITTPIPGPWPAFLWKLLSRPTHTVRVRIAEALFKDRPRVNGVGRHGESEDEAQQGITAAEEQVVLDRIAEALARLGRNTRVSLTVDDKRAFVAAWRKKGRK